jgi:NAD(P)-dependent dehydrogenase (short-subunit alcohol dehydrogenase family)
LRVRRFENKVVAVTGGASGIGQAIGERFADEGARIALVDISAQRIQVALDSLAGRAVASMGVAADVTQVPALDDAFRRIVQQLGGVDVLVNSAGVISRATMAETSAEQWRHVLDVDLSAIFFATQAAVPHMLRRSGGSVINIASVAGLLAVVNAAYVAAKGGVIALTRQLASELAAKGIRVNAISPGYVRTPLNQDIRAEGGDRYWIGRIPLRRYAEPREIAAACAFLASDDASYVTAANLVVDGGMSSVLLPDPVPA